MERIDERYSIDNVDDLGGGCSVSCSRLHLRGRQGRSRLMARGAFYVGGPVEFGESDCWLVQSKFALHNWKHLGILQFKTMVVIQHQDALGALALRSVLVSTETITKSIPGRRGEECRSLSQPPRHYLGPACDQHEIQIPRDLQGRRIVLTLGRPH